MACCEYSIKIGKVYHFFNKASLKFFQKNTKNVSTRMTSRTSTIQGAIGAIYSIHASDSQHLHRTQRQWR